MQDGEEIIEKRSVLCRYYTVFNVQQCEGLRIQPTQPAEKQPQVQPIERLTKFSPQQVGFTEPAGEKIETVLTLAPGIGASIGGLKVIAESGWFAARSSGTDNIYKIYSESFRT